MVKINVHTKFRWDTSIHCRDKTTSGFGKRMAAILEFYLLFRFWPMCSYRHVILRQPAKFRLNQTIAADYDVISILKDGGHRVRKLLPSSVLVINKVKIYLRTKFRRDISIHGWDKTTSGFGKRTAAILEFYFRFRFWPTLSPRHVILLQPAKFRRNQAIFSGVMIFWMAAMESEIYFWVQV